MTLFEYIIEADIPEPGNNITQNCACLYNVDIYVTYVGYLKSSEAIITGRLI